MKVLLFGLLVLFGFKAACHRAEFHGSQRASFNRPFRAEVSV